LGHEITGEIVESRSSTPRFKIGDRVQVFPGVCCGECPACRRGLDNLCPQIAIIGFTRDGGFAEFVGVPSESIAYGGINLIPERVSSEEAALIEPLASCLNGQQLASLSGRDTVLILGAGPIGLLHTMLARTMGVARVLVTDRLSSRLEAAKKAGADRVIDIERVAIETVVQDETGGRGVDVGIVACSEVDPSLLLRLLAPRGRLCLFSGLPVSDVKTPWDFNLIHYRELAIMGAYGSTVVQNTAALRLIDTGKISVGWLITKRLSLDELPQGLDYVAQRAGLKAVVLP
jgi:L-iditol 2-dehydrogenase